MRYSTRVLSIGVLLIGLILVSSVPANPTRAVASTSLAPTGLSISTIPPQLPADNNTYPAVVVTVVDSAGQPTIALVNTNVSLTSSEEYVGTITAGVVVPAGQTYAIANFTTTHTPGVTTITATTTGLVAASSQVTTVIAVGYPTHLEINAVPNTVAASEANTGHLFLELKDDAGLPAKAVADIPISLYSSNTNVVNVTAATTVMKQGEYLQEINYTSGFVPGSAQVTASATGFASGSTTISVQGSPPLALRLQAQPSSMPACSGFVNGSACDGRLVVALTDLSGNPTLATRNIQVQIRSSNLDVVNASETTTIQAGNISAIATFIVTSASGGNAVITASSPGLQSSFATITVKPTSFVSPFLCTTQVQNDTCQLAISAGPNPVLADHRSYSSVVVSLETGAGPAVNATGPTEVTLTSSVTGVGNFTRIKFTIPEGHSWASVTFTTTYQVGASVLTASAQNILSVQTSLDTYGAVPSQVLLNAISSPLPADGASHSALELSLEDAFNSPAVATSDIPVNLTSSEPGVVGVADAVIPAGQTFAIVNVTAGILQGTANITALVSSSLLGSSNAISNSTTTTNSTASGYAVSATTLSTVIPAPSGIAAIAPNGDTLIFSQTTSSEPPLFAVQLESSANTPARARSPVNITITSSNSTVISKILSVSIGVGQDYAEIPLVANVPGKTTLTLTTPGLSTTSVPVTFLSYPSVETITGGPASIYTNQTAVISVNLALDGTPFASAPVAWKVSGGGLVVSTPHPTNSSGGTTTSTSTLSSSARSTRSTLAPAGAPAVNDTTDKLGSSIVVFHPTKPGSVLITAEVTPGGLLAKTLNFTIKVSSPPPSVVASKQKTSLVSELTTFPLLLAPVGGAGGAVAAVFLIRKRKGGGAAGEEEFDTSFE